MSTVAAEPARGSRRRRAAIARLAGSPIAVVGLVLLILAVIGGVGAPVLSPYDPTRTNFDAPYQVPGTVGYLLGTDHLGRDQLSRMLFGIRSSLVVGLLSVALAVVVGTPLGLIAGYWRRIDGVISRLTDVTLAFPFLILAVGLAAILGPSMTTAAISLGVAQVPIMVRVVRGETLRLKENDFVLAAVAMSESGARIMFTHILPNCLSVIIIQATVIMPVSILGEAVLSFLGLGIQPPAPSLGIMLSDAQQDLTRTAWPAIVPGVAIVLICLAFNVVGDALRDLLDADPGEV